MREKFRDHRFSSENLHLLGSVAKIIEHYNEQNIRMTLRQLYYQLVAADIIPNTQKSYAKISKLLTDARYAGEVSWEAIEDRVRIPYRHPQFDGLSELVRAAKHSYRLDRWAGQEYYLELWTEKDALSSVIKPIADKFHVYLSVNRGYSSASAMFGAYQRFFDQAESKKCVILYLGDHDPSGLDMVRDISDRLCEFGVDLECNHIALTTNQVKEYKPPPNPAKISDPRATGYIKRHGTKSWEVDALKPELMTEIIEDAITEYVDLSLMQKICKKEERDIKKLEKFVKGL